MASRAVRARDSPPSDGISKSARTAARDSKAAVKKNHGQSFENFFEVGLELEAATDKHYLV